jgi:hypothetical protein
VFGAGVVGALVFARRYAARPEPVAG